MEDISGICTATVCLRAKLAAPLLLLARYGVGYARHSLTVLDCTTRSFLTTS